jgi:hypothetical protein
MGKIPQSPISPWPRTESHAIADRARTYDADYIGSRAATPSRSASGQLIGELTVSRSIASPIRMTRADHLRTFLGADFFAAAALRFLAIHAAVSSAPLAQGAGPQGPDTREGLQIRPSKSRTITISSTKPSPPLG